MAHTITHKENGKAAETGHEPFVSVLTPVYNGDKFLRECIESVLKQDYDNWEYVLVNNQSTDRSLQIMEEYAAKDKRIRIHNNEDFLPQMENLNAAFRHISSESKYCKVIHADDIIFQDCLTKMVEVGEQYPSVGIISAYRLNGSKVDLDGLDYKNNFYAGKEIAKRYLKNGTSYFGAPSNLLIRSDLIQEREKIYDESYLSSDTGACLELLKDSDFGFAHQVLTFTRLHENSATNTIAEENYELIQGLIKIQAEFGPYYLTKQEADKQIDEKINLFYILLARNIIQNRSIREARKQLDVIKNLDLKFETGKFVKNFVREIFIELFWAAGLDLKRKRG